MPRPSRLLIVNADDFGFNRDVNAGILEAHRSGVLTSTTLMANGDAFEEAVCLARDAKTLSVGCHLVLIQGRSLVSGEALPRNWKELLRALISRRIDPYSELRAQVERMIAAGLHPSHFDTHKHTHVLPAVLSAVIRLANDFNVPFIRLPFDADWLPVRFVDRKYRRHLEAAHLRCTDHFLGFRLTDTLTEDTLLRAFSSLPTGTTEFMCHPGYWGEELERAETRLRQSRQRELEALTAPAVRALLERENIVLTNYRALAEGRS